MSKGDEDRLTTNEGGDAEFLILSQYQVGQVLEAVSLHLWLHGRPTMVTTLQYS